MSAESTSSVEVDRVVIKGDDVPARFSCKKVHCFTVGELIFVIDIYRRCPGLGRFIVDSELNASSEKMPPSMVDSQLLRPVYVDMYSFEVGTEEHSTPWLNNNDNESQVPE